MEVKLGKGRSVRDVCKAIGIYEVKHYRWRREYGGLEVDQPKRMAGPDTWKKVCL